MCIFFRRGGIRVLKITDPDTGPFETLFFSRSIAHIFYFFNKYVPYCMNKNKVYNFIDRTRFPFPDPFNKIIGLIYLRRTQYFFPRIRSISIWIRNSPFFAYLINAVLTSGGMCFSALS